MNAIASPARPVQLALPAFASSREFLSVPVPLPRVGVRPRLWIFEFFSAGAGGDCTNGPYEQSFYLGCAICVNGTGCTQCISDTLYQQGTYEDAYFSINSNYSIASAPKMGICVGALRP